jgi:Ca-activated chloride channel family protein
LVPGLTQEDFEVYDNDKPAADRLLRQQRPPNQRRRHARHQRQHDADDRLAEARRRAVRHPAAAGRQGRVGAFNDKVQISSRFTSDRDELVSSVKDVDFGNSTRLWDGVAMGLEELKTVDGRRVVLVFTDGDDTDSRTNLGTVVERARADETMVYAIGLESNYFNGQRYVKSKPDRGLKRLADETGGGYFELEKTSDLAPTFTKVAAELHSQYVIGFAPTQLDGRVHKLAVKMKQPGLTARARRSYVAAPDKFSVSEK